MIGEFDVDLSVTVEIFLSMPRSHFYCHSVHTVRNFGIPLKLYKDIFCINISVMFDVDLAVTFVFFQTR